MQFEENQVENEDEISEDLESIEEDPSDESAKG